MNPLEHSISLHRQCRLALDWIDVRYDGAAETFNSLAIDPCLPPNARWSRRRGDSTQRRGAAATIARGYQYAALSPGRYGHRNRNAQVEAEGRRDIADIAKLGTVGAWVRQPLRIRGCRGGIDESA